MTDRKQILPFVRWLELHRTIHQCEVLIVACGFEDRALVALRQLARAGISKVVLIRFLNGPKLNDKRFDEAKLLLSKGRIKTHEVVDLDVSKPQIFERELFVALQRSKTSETGQVWIDISSLPNYAVCAGLKASREVYQRSRIKILYTEALEYFPTKDEFVKCSAKSGGTGLELIPDALTSEMRENLILSSFAGFTIRQDKTCLFLFAGFEKHRSLGAIESMNPSKLVILFGKPGNSKLAWRTSLSKEMHENLFRQLDKAEEEVSTLDPSEVVKVVDEYYQMLYDDYSLCIAPLNSKMQAVASYLLWEKYPDIQLAFPLPINYLPSRFSKGAGQTFSYELPMLTTTEAVFGAS